MNFPELLAWTAIVLAAPHMNPHVARLMALIFAILGFVLNLLEFVLNLVKKGWFA